ncbi:hypothetical protein Kpol_243p1 [Vanderwaltozyma polyspora DSM 70294]|uniref:DUF2423 domain-containing protein n=1 Tax=Vanderwaltozyma polyspora (strain ATCC 22028 / DSM 70294 / BCRC 21397 / CBS 2163 / NBRC 10782 / NRRL Y-8283 / UCD 57-17) TaxID=436907 RepID=A7TTB7_VANPO|nr:uncharacterized protein Kpol_243p1 [Vanderwaltozyma polyspora DSM 70294]EDO14487.1 hypothetical protein Kpol_243p1 [Vanderwaltozyma polyspora DSM 70294]
MAKSLRASTRLNAKSVIRKGVFQKVVDDRASRVADKLKKDLINQKLKDLKEKEGMEIDEATLLKNEEEAKKEANDKKVSTSGWRDARHHNYKKAKLGKNKKKGSFTRF